MSIVPDDRDGVFVAAETASSDRLPDVDMPPAVDDSDDAPDVSGAALTQFSRFGMLGASIQFGLALAVLLLAVLSPDSTSAILARVVGYVFVAASVVSIAEARRVDRRRRSLILGVALATSGALLAVDPERWLAPIGWVFGGLVAIVGAVSCLRHRARSSKPPQLSLRSGALLVPAGFVIVVSTEPLFRALSVSLALLAAASGVISVGVRGGLVEVDPRTERYRPVLLRWIEHKGQSTQRRDGIYEAVFFEGAGAPARIGRFMLMMLFASVISAAGIISDSTAVVIGAMLVAPLINPMMGMGLSLATGWPNRLGRSGLVMLGGTAVAIATAWVVAAVARSPVDLIANSQIVGRSSPGLIDLVIAVAAGAAGAYGLSRRDASSSLPGVAVAIALVPPLSVVGITAHAGDWDQASGTLLLFLTNLVAIILAGGTVFILTGVVPLRRFAENQHRVRTSLGAVAALAVLVVGALVINGRQIAEDALAQDAAGAIVANWLGDDTEFEVLTIDVDDGVVAVVLVGPGDPPSAERLADELAEELDDRVRVDLQWIPRQRVLAVSG